jgi:outer membrane protein OmpA-like peptidoglycan-associated protein
LKQTEQSGSKIDSLNPQKVIFKIIDAITATPLAAKICLVSTRHKTKICFDADVSGQVRVPFIEQDIWAMTIENSGYQNYQGTFVVENLDGQEQQHAIGLLKDLSLASLQKTNQSVEASNKEKITIVELPDTLAMLYFEQSSYELSPKSKQTLKEVANILKQQPTYQLLLTGYADSGGDGRLNRSLSEFRAKVAASYLHTQGIADDRTAIEGHGTTQIDQNLPNNRRVHLKFSIKQ